MVHVPQFLAKWKRNRVLYMAVPAYTMIMTFYYALSVYSEGYGLRPTGEVVNFGRWVTFILVANIAMTALTHILYIHKGQYYFVRFFGTLAPAMLLLSTCVVTREAVIIFYIGSALCTAVAFFFVLPGDYLTKNRFSDKYRNWANRYSFFTLSVLVAFIIQGFVFLLVRSNLLTSYLNATQEAIANVIVDVVTMVYFAGLVNFVFMTSKLEVFRDEITDEHTHVTGEYDGGSSNSPLYPGTQSQVTSSPSLSSDSHSIGMFGSRSAKRRGGVQLY